MMIWIFRAAVLVVSPAFVYLQISNDIKGVGIGLAVAIFVVGLEMFLERFRLLTIIVGLLGAFVGLILAKFLDYGVVQMESEKLLETWSTYSTLVRIGLAYLGMTVMIQKFPEIGDLDKDILAAGRKRGQDLKVLDTSAIVDGRIIDICQTNFLSGSLIAPRFVLNELHALADSSDSLRRARGRRGLDILSRLQESEYVPVKILDKDVPEVDEVDAKVVKLAKDLGAKLITTDFNLNKMSALEGVPVLNVNDLSTALKPVVLPGEQMNLFVMKEGKERDQGVGYLDDGTMVVVEDGRRHIGKRVEASVVSILQTSAGRMIFAKVK